MARSFDEYVALAVLLATNPAVLDTVRVALFQADLTPLFNRTEAAVYPEVFKQLIAAGRGAADPVECMRPASTRAAIRCAGVQHHRSYVGTRIPVLSGAALRLP